MSSADLRKSHNQAFIKPFGVAEMCLDWDIFLRQPVTITFAIYSHFLTFILVLKRLTAPQPVQV